MRMKSTWEAPRMGLFTPKWMEDPEETKKLTDQKKLQKAFAKAHHPEVLKAAGWRIEDQAFLVDILEHSRVRFLDILRWELLGRVTRPELLEHIINANYKDGAGFDFLDRQVAIRKVKDAALLTRIALEDEWPDNRLVAVQCLTDLDALRKVASESRDSNVREKAAAIVKANEPKKAEPPRPAAPVQKAPRPEKPREGADVARGIGSTGSASKPAPQASAAGGYNALSGPAAAEYVNKLSPRQLMELILFGEDGQEANNVIWLCNRLAAKMMIPHETGDRATIEMFFLAFSGVPARNHYRSLTGFWPPSQAEAAFTQTMLQFAALPRSLRDMHARLYLEHYGRM